MQTNDWQSEDQPYKPHRSLCTVCRQQLWPCTLPMDVIPTWSQWSLVTN